MSNTAQENKSNHIKANILQWFFVFYTYFKHSDLGLVVFILFFIATLGFSPLIGSGAVYYVSLGNPVIEKTLKEVRTAYFCNTEQENDATATNDTYPQVYSFQWRDAGPSASNSNSNSNDTNSGAPTTPDLSDEKPTLINVIYDPGRGYYMQLANPEEKLSAEKAARALSHLRLNHLCVKTKTIEEPFTAQTTTFEARATGGRIIQSWYFLLLILLGFFAVAGSYQLQRLRNEGKLEHWIALPNSPFLPALASFFVVATSVLSLSAISYTLSAFMWGELALNGLLGVTALAAAAWGFIQYQILITVFFHHLMGRYLARFLFFPLSVVGLSIPMRYLGTAIEQPWRDILPLVTAIVGISLITGFICFLWAKKRIGLRREGLRKT